MTIRGATADQRQAERAKQRHKRQIEFHGGRIRAARNGREVLVYACAYVQAVGRGLDDDGMRALALAITKVADERNQP